MVDSGSVNASARTCCGRGKDVVDQSHEPLAYPGRNRQTGPGQGHQNGDHHDLGGLDQEPAVSAFHSISDQPSPAPEEWLPYCTADCGRKEVMPVARLSGPHISIRLRVAWPCHAGWPKSPHTWFEKGRRGCSRGVSGSS